MATDTNTNLEAAMVTKTKKTTIQRDATKGSQSWDLLAVYKLQSGTSGTGWTHEFKLRIEVKIDSYKNQSFARCKVWSGATMSWNLIAEILFGAMVGAGHPHEAEGMLATNEARLLELATAVLK